MEPIYGVQAAMISCFIHSNWPLLTYGTIYLNEQYLSLPDKAWINMWIITGVSHLLSGAVLYLGAINN